MRGRQLTALQRAEQRDYYGWSKLSDVSNMLWMADWRAIGLPYCSIYVISPQDGWPCKIGISTNPIKRINTLQTACWKQLEVKWCAWAPTVQKAHDLELRSHRTLTDMAKWLHGEWFDLRPDKAIDLVSFEAELAGIEISTELPPGASTDFVQKLFASRYGTAKGQMDQMERRAEFLGMDDR